MAEKTTDRPMTLFQKLAAIRKMVGVISKNESGFNYKYSDINEILIKVRAGMEKYGVSLVPNFVHGTESVEQIEIVKTKIDKATKQPYDNKSTEFLVKSEVYYTWIDDATGERFDVPWLLTAQMEDAAQAQGAGLTYGMRQFLTNFFQTPQDNDVDKLLTKKKEAEKVEDTEIAATIIEQLDVAVKAFVASNPDKRDDVVKLVKKYVKDGNYNNIKEPKLAAKLAEEFENTFLKGEQ